MARWVFLFLMLIACPGCASWFNIFRFQSPDPESPTLLHQAQMSPDSVVLEISILTLPSEKAHQIDELFKMLDVSKVDLEQRKIWDRNGLRVATSGTSLPMEFESLMASEIDAENSEDNSDETKMAPRRRLQARSGKPFRVATNPVLPELTWFMMEENGYRHGGSREAAQTEFEVRSFAQGDGSTRLMIHPKIYFGEPKQTVTTANASLRYEMKRDEIRFPNLRLETQLSLGESLILAANSNGQSAETADSQFGLGRAFFNGKAHQCKMVVIRLAQSQKDDLFDSSQNSQSLESITEQ